MESGKLAGLLESIHISHCYVLTEVRDLVLLLQHCYKMNSCAYMHSKIQTVDLILNGKTIPS